MQGNNFTFEAKFIQLYFEIRVFFTLLQVFFSENTGSIGVIQCFSEDCNMMN